MPTPTAEVLRESRVLGPQEVERLNPELDSVQVGDRLRLTIQLPLLSPEYAREFLFTAFPFLGSPGSHLDLGPYLRADTTTAALDYQTGLMTIEATVIQEASPGVPLLVVVTAAVIALAAFFPSAVVVLVERLSRVSQSIGQGLGATLGTTAAQALGGLTRGLGTATMLLLAVAAALILNPAGAASAAKTLTRKGSP